MKQTLLQALLILKQLEHTIKYNF